MGKREHKRKRWPRQAKDGDTSSSPDIIVLVMGPSGVGKSTFINSLAGRETMKVGEDLDSCTSDVDYIILPIPPNHPQLEHRRLVVVDTPGFNDTSHDEIVALKRVASWLESSYANRNYIGGIIYLNDISQKRMLRSTILSYDVFKNLAGPPAFSKVIMATTQWDTIDEEVGINRQQELREKFWKDILAGGAKIESIKKKPEDEWKLIDLILKRVEEKEQNPNL